MEIMEIILTGSRKMTNTLVNGAGTSLAGDSTGERGQALQKAQPHILQHAGRMELGQAGRLLL